jgi:hypothetical protein
MLSQALHGSFADSAEQRAADRRILRLTALAETPTGQGGIDVHNLSRTGMLVECAEPLAPGTRLEVELPGGSRHQAEVVWGDEGLLGCRFSESLTKAQLSAALLRAAPAPAHTAAAPVRLSHGEAMARLGQHWAVEVEAATGSERKLPLATRMWVIGGLALAGWAVPAAAAWLLL